MCKVLEFNRSKYYRQKKEMNSKNETQILSLTFSPSPPAPTAITDAITDLVPNQKNKSQDKEIISKVEEICGNYPNWGSRRVKNWLEKRENIVINRKTVQRIMREKNLLVKTKKKIASRQTQKKKPQPEKPNQWWGIDMTKFLVQSCGWIYFVAIIDWYSRKVVGYSIGRNCCSDLWISALDKAVIEEFTNGSRAMELSLMSDNGSQPTSKKFLKICIDLDIKQAFTSYNNPKGNANTERFFRTLKEDCIWINEFSNYDEAVMIINDYINFYNTVYLHSSLNYKSPIEFLNEYYNQNVA